MDCLSKITLEQWTALTAIGTLLLGVVALLGLFREQIRSWFSRPRFAVAFTPGQPDCHGVPMMVFRPGRDAVSIQAHFIRCRIVNSGPVAAKDVEVAVTEVRKRDATGTFRTLNITTPWNLVWAHHDVPVLPQIPANGTARHIVIGHVADPAQRHLLPTENIVPESGAADTLFCLGFHVLSNTREYLLQPGYEYEVEFEVAASNAAPKRFVFVLNQKGRWFADEHRMYSDGLGMSVRNA